MPRPNQMMVPKKRKRELWMLDFRILPKVYYKQTRINDICDYFFKVYMPEDDENKCDFKIKLNKFFSISPLSRRTS